MKDSLKGISIVLTIVSVICFFCYSIYYIQTNVRQPVKLTLVDKVKMSVGLTVEKQKPAKLDFMTSEVDPILIENHQLTTTEKIKNFFSDSWEKTKTTTDNAWQSTKDFSSTTWEKTKSKSKNAWYTTKDFTSTIYNHMTFLKDTEK